MVATPKPQVDIGEYKYGFRDKEDYVFKSKKGLNREVVEEISKMKGEPDWMLEFRRKSLEHFEKRPMPNWGSPGLADLDLQDIFYYVRAAEKQGKTWDEVPSYIKDTFDKLGIPEAEKKFLAGVGAQYESEVIYHSLRKDLEATVVNQHFFDEALKLYDEGYIRVALDNNDIGFNSFFKRGWKRFYLKWYGDFLPSASALSRPSGESGGKAGHWSSAGMSRAW